MKKSGIVLAVLASVAIAQADLYVNSVISYGIYARDGVSDLIDKDGGQSLIELYSAGANGVADFEASPSAGTLGDVLVGGSGDDVFLGSMIFTAAGGVYDGQVSGANWTVADDTIGENLVIFARVFSGLGEEGDWYYQGETFATDGTTDIGAGDPPESYFIDGGAPGQNAVMGQVVPEPATIGLMGIAGLGMYLARRKVRR